MKSDRWTADPFLRRQMRNRFRHGQTSVNYQIILDLQCYSVFEHKKKLWLAVMSLERGKRIAIPLKGSVAPSGTLRLILKDNKVAIHYSVEEETVCQMKPCGPGEIGIDKGYTEAFTDSDGQRHGNGLGEMLSAQSDKLKLKYKRRNKLLALLKKYEAQGKSNKRSNLIANNLGRKKWDAQGKQHRANVRDLIFKATHSVVDKANTIAVEDLTSPIPNKKKYGKDQSRRLSGWTKGIMADALTRITDRRGASAVLVNAAYTSQMDSRSGLLQGTRNGNSFYCLDGAVLDADQNAARNILARMRDTKIKLYSANHRIFIHR